MPYRRIITLLLITIILLAGCHFPGQPWVLVEVLSHEDGQSIAVNEDITITTQARSSQGIARVELYVNGELASTEEPPMGNPREYIVELAFTPLVEEPVIISLVAVDRRGTISEPFSITLEVVPFLDDEDIEATPTPTVPPEELALTQTAQASCTNSASFVEHVTIPDGTQITANTNFTKIWRVNNNGTCDWIGFQVVHAEGNQMGASSPKALPVVAAGANADIVVEMVAPASSGTHAAVWRIQSGDGTMFGPNLGITINVPLQPTNTLAPTATATLVPTATATTVPTATATLVPTVTATATISVQQISEQVSIPANTNEARTITCPAGSVVVSGGFSHQTGIRIWQTVKDGNGWRINATNTQANARNLTITATCMFNTPGTTTITSREEAATPNDLKQLTTNCPAGSLITGGGWAIAGNPNINVFQSSLSGNGWQVSFNNTSGDTPDLTVYAVCLSGVSGSTSRRENIDNTVLPNSTATASMSCAAGSFVTGGGFAMDRELLLNHTVKEENGWINNVRNPTGEEKRLDTYVICYQP